MIKRLIQWIKDLWQLLKVVAKASPKPPVTSPTLREVPKPTTTFIPKEKTVEKLSERSRDFFGRNAVRSKYVELDGYSECFSVDSRGRYCIKQLSNFLGNFCYMSGFMIDEFLEGTSYWEDTVDGKVVYWVDRDDAIEYSFQHYAALADLL